MTKAAEARAFVANYPEKVREVVETAPPVPADALALLEATGFPFPRAKTEAA